MNNLLSKKDQRYLIILESLFHANYMTLSELSKLTKTSTRNIQNDIQEINLFIDPMIITTSLREGCYLNYPNEISIDHLYRCILKNSIEFNLIELAFFEKHSTLDDYANELFVSLSTMKRLVKDINHTIEPTGFKLSTSPLELIGDEQTICSFMMHYFSEAYRDLDLPFPKIQIEALDKIIFFVLSKNDATINYPDLYMLKLIMIVSIVRLQNKHTFPNTKVFPPHVDTGVLNDFFSKQIFKTIFKLTLNEDVLFRLLYPFVNGKFAKDYDHLLEMAELNPDVLTNVKNINAFIQSLSSDFNIPIENENRIVLELFNSQHMIIRESYVLYNKKKIFIENFIHDTPHLSTMIYSSIQRSSTFNRELKRFELEELMYILITQWSGFAEKIKVLKPTHTVGLFMDSDVEHTEFVASILNQRFYSKLRFTVLRSVSIPKMLKEAKNFDVVVTNISDLTNGKTTFISIGIFPTVKDYNKLELIYDTLSYSH